MNHQGILIVISGFSGVGKGTLVKRLLSDWPAEFVLSVSATTRAPRAGEADGREYFFISREDFLQKIEAGRFLEYNEYNGNFYGTPRDFVEEELAFGKNVILEIDFHGALNIRKLFPEAYLVFVVPQNAAQLSDRLRSRGTETEEEIRGRLLQALTETDYLTYYDYTAVNDDLDTCLFDIHQAITREKDRLNALREYGKAFKEELSLIIEGE